MANRVYLSTAGVALVVLEMVAIPVPMLMHLVASVRVLLLVRVHRVDRGDDVAVEVLVAVALVFVVVVMEMVVVPVVEIMVPAIKPELIVVAVVVMIEVQQAAMAHDFIEIHPKLCPAALHHEREQSNRHQHPPSHRRQRPATRFTNGRNRSLSG